MTETGSAGLGIVPGHHIQLYVGINQNNLNGFSYPAGDTAFRAEGTLTQVSIPTDLDINSSNPESGVPITVYTPIIGVCGTGTRHFTCQYDKGQSASINAPATLSGGTKAFDHWDLDGVTQDLPER